MDFNDQLDSLAFSNRLILETLSIAYHPLKARELSELLASLGHRQSPAELRSHLDSLVELGLVSPVMSAYRAEWQGAVLRRLVDRDRAEAERYHQVVLPALETHHSRDSVPTSLKDSPLLTNQLVREARREALFEGDLDLSALISSFKVQRRESEALLTRLEKSLASRPYDALWIKYIPSELRLRHLQRRSSAESIERLDRELIRGLQLHLEEAEATPEVVSDLTRFLVYSGEIAEAQRLLERYPQLEIFSSRAWVSILSGDLTHGVELFESGLKAWRASHRKRSAIPNTLEALWCVTGVMLLRDVDVAQSYLGSIKKVAKESSHYESEWRLLLWAHKHKAFARSGAVSEPLSLPKQSASSSLHSRAFQAVIGHLCGVNVDIAEAQSDLFSLRSQLRERSLDWLAREVSAMIERAITPHQPTLSSPTPLWIDLGDSSVHWSSRLDSLRSIFMGDDPNTTMKRKRLVWLLDFIEPEGRLVLEAKIQERRDAQDSWTSGRSLSIESLINRSAEFHFLTLKDRRLCDHLMMSLEERTSQSETQDDQQAESRSHSLDSLEALRVLIDHPLLYWRGHPTRSVELKRIDPQLRVSTTLDGGWEVEVAPRPTSSLNYHLARSGDRLELCIFTPAQLRAHEVIGDHPLKIPYEGEEALRDVLTYMSHHYPLASDLPLSDHVTFIEVEPDPRLFIRINRLEEEQLEAFVYVQPIADGVTISPAKGGASLSVVANGVYMRTTRDLERERMIAERVIAIFNQYAEASAYESRWRTTGIDQSLPLLIALRSLGEEVVVEWPQRAPLNVKRQSAGALSLSVNGQARAQWFEVEGTLQIDDQRALQLGELLRLIETSPAGFIRLSQDEYLELTEELSQQLTLITPLLSPTHLVDDEAKEDPQPSLLIHPVFISSLTELFSSLSAQGSLTLDPQWYESLRKIEEAREMSALLPLEFKATLRPYQSDGFRWLCELSSCGGGACLADDMGLGKTVQLLAFLSKVGSEGPSIVIAPTSVVPNWVQEAERFAPQLTPYSFAQSGRRELVDRLGPHDVLFVSYGVVVSEIECLTTQLWNVMVFDEAQAIKNPNTQRFQALSQLRAERRVAATGTPIENHLYELWSIFTLTNPGLLGDLKEFQQRFTAPMERGDQAARERLRAIINPFILRRLKSEVLDDLPTKIEQTLHIELSAEERLLYEAIRRRAVAEIAEMEVKVNYHKVFALLMQLRQACCHPQLILDSPLLMSSETQESTSPMRCEKHRVLHQLIRSLRSNGHRALIFSQFVRHLKIVRAWLDQEGISYQYLDGETPTERRKRAVDDFQSGEGDLFLISLRAGGQGLNLTSANYVIHLDPWWNPAVEDQATDRAYRIGQTQAVTVYRLITTDTVEEKVLALHSQKRALAEQVLSGTSTPHALDLEALVSLIVDTPASPGS